MRRPTAAVRERARACADCLAEGPAGTMALQAHLDALGLLDAVEAPHRRCAAHQTLRLMESYGLVAGVKAARGRTHEVTWRLL